MIFTFEQTSFEAVISLMLSPKVSGPKPLPYTVIRVPPELPVYGLIESIDGMN